VTCFEWMQYIECPAYIGINYGVKSWQASEIRYTLLASTGWHSGQQYIARGHHHVEPRFLCPAVVKHMHCIKNMYF